MSLLFSGVTDFTIRHTANNIEEKAAEILKSWNISTEKVVACLTDGASNITLAAKQLCGSPDQQIHCLAHQLDLVLEYAFETKIKSVHNGETISFNIKSKCFSPALKIVFWFRNSSIARDELKIVESLRVVNYCETRWNSAYLVLDRLLKLLPSINNILWKYPEAPAMLSADDSTFLREILSNLKLFYDMTLNDQSLITCHAIHVN